MGEGQCDTKLGDSEGEYAQTLHEGCGSFTQAQKKFCLGSPSRPLFFKDLLDYTAPIGQHDLDEIQPAG